MGRKRNHAKLEMLFAPGVSSNLFKSARAHLQLGKFLGSKMGNLLECSRAAAAEADSGVVNINGGGAGVQAGGVVVDAPRTVAVGIARLDVSDVQNLRAVLPESDVTGLVAGAFVESFDVKPLASRNVLDGLRIGSFRVLIVKIDVHGAVGAISNIEGEEGGAGVAAWWERVRHLPSVEQAIHHGFARIVA